MIEKQQDMEVLGAYLSPSMSIKDRFIVRPHVMLNACLALSWSDPMIRPQSQVVQFRPSPDKWKCTHWRQYGCAESQWHESKGGFESRSS